MGKRCNLMLGIFVKDTDIPNYANRAFVLHVEIWNAFGRRYPPLSNQNNCFQLQSVGKSKTNDLSPEWSSTPDSSGENSLVNPLMPKILDDEAQRALNIRDLHPRRSKRLRQHDTPSATIASKSISPPIPLSTPKQSKHQGVGKGKKKPQIRSKVDGDHSETRLQSKNYKNCKGK